MPIVVQCQGCNKRIKAAEKYAGKRVKCPGCKSVLTIPAVGGDGAPPQQAAPEPKPAASAPESPPNAIRKSVETLECYVRDIMKHYGQSEFEGHTQAKEVLAIYSFGGISALALQQKMDQPQAHAICITVFNKVFEFTQDDAVAKAWAVISAASDKTSQFYPIIHRGLDGFLHWQEQGGNGAAEDFADIMGYF